jgi:hypothetical protein
MYGGCAIGRPFTVRGQARVAPAVPGGGFAAELAIDVDGVSAQAKRALADAYQKDTLTEHASIAAFARFLLQCSALGAPLELLGKVRQAMADELDHAKLCAGLAVAYGAAPFCPGQLDTEGAFEHTDLPGVAEKTVRESCVAETVSVMLLLRASQAAQRQPLKGLLAKMAEDELRHALLGFEFVGWALRQGDPQVRFRVARAFADANHAVGFGAFSAQPAPETELRAHGYLSIEERRSVAERTLSEILKPCARALLQPAPSAQTAPPVAIRSEV